MVSLVRHRGVLFRAGGWLERLTLTITEGKIWCLGHAGCSEVMSCYSAAAITNAVNTAAAFRDNVGD